MEQWGQDWVNVGVGRTQIGFHVLIWYPRMHKTQWIWKDWCRTVRFLIPNIKSQSINRLMISMLRTRSSASLVLFQPASQEIQQSATSALRKCRIWIQWSTTANSAVWFPARNVCTEKWSFNQQAKHSLQPKAWFVKYAIGNSKWIAITWDIAQSWVLKTTSWRNNRHCWLKAHRSTPRCSTSIKPERRIMSSCRRSTKSTYYNRLDCWKTWRMRFDKPR